jgi:hypothetical protein
MDCLAGQEKNIAALNIDSSTDERKGNHTNYTKINTFISTLRNMDIDFKFQIYYIFRCRKEQ